MLGPFVSIVSGCDKQKVEDIRCDVLEDMAVVLSIDKWVQVEYMAANIEGLE